MIPKIIHYCWFGDLPIPDEHRSFIKEWQELLPGFTFKLWNEQNSPLDNDYCRTALAMKNWANISNFVRLYALFGEGGIYLDTDVKIIKPLNPLLDVDCFLGFEDDQPPFAVNNAVLGSIKAHPFIGKCLEAFKHDFNGEEKAHESAPSLVTAILKQEYGLKSGGTQHLRDVTLFSKDYFYPIHWNEAYKLSNYSQHITKETYAVHFWHKSWFTHEMLNKSLQDWQKWAHDLQTQNQELQKSLQSSQEFINEKLSNQIEALKVILNNAKTTLDSSQKEVAGIYQSMQLPLPEKMQPDMEEKILDRFDAIQSYFQTFHEKNANIHESIRTIQQTIIELKEQNASHAATFKDIHENQLIDRHLLQQIQSSMQSLSAAIASIKLRNNSMEILAAANLEYKTIIEKLGTEIRSMHENFIQKEQTLLNTIANLSDHNSWKKERSDMEGKIAEKQSEVNWYQRTYELRSLPGLLKQWLQNKLKKK